MSDLVVRLSPGERFDGSVAGLLVVSWAPPEAAARFAETGELPPEAIATMVRNAVTLQTSTATLLEGVHVTPPPGLAANLAPIAVFDAERRFWTAVIEGGGECLVAAGQAASDAPLELTRQRRPAKPAPPPATGFERMAVQAPHGETLPLAVRPSRGLSEACVFLLAGLGGDETVRFLDSDFLAAVAGSHDPSLVGVSMRTSVGSAYLSVEAPAWTETLAALPSLVRPAMATPPTANVLAGQSTGGFTAVSHALLRPGAFDAIVASAPDALDLESWLLDETGAIAPLALAWMRLETAVGAGGQMSSFAASWSPRGRSEACWPVDLESGVVRPEILDRWLANSPLRLLERPEAQDGLRALQGRLYIGAARQDEFGLYEPTLRFCERLDELGIAHQLRVDDRSHFDAGPRLAEMIGAALDDLATRPPPTGDSHD